MKLILRNIVLLVFVATTSFAQQNKYTHPDEPMHLPPEVDFGWSGACLGDSTHFYNATLRAVTYTWTITSATGTVTTTLYTSNDTDIVFLFPAVGTYSVELIGDNGHVVSLMKTLTIDTVTAADFSFMHCVNIFSNMSTCYSSCAWDFGDGGTSTSFTPIHQFPDSGTYTVTLIVYNGLQSDTLQKTVTITATHIVNPVFTHYQSNDTIYVHAIDSDVGMAYYWTWGDGTNSTGQDTFHIYPTPGTYSVTLVEQNGCGFMAGNDTIGVVAWAGYSVREWDNAGIRIFPNPVESGSDMVVEWKRGGEVQALGIENVFGVLCQREITKLQLKQSSYRFNTRGLPAGLYFLSIQSGGMVRRTAFVIN